MPRVDMVFVDCKQCLEQRDCPIDFPITEQQVADEVQIFAGGLVHCFKMASEDLLLRIPFRHAECRRFLRVVSNSPNSC